MPAALHAGRKVTEGMTCIRIYISSRVQTPLDGIFSIIFTLTLSGSRASTKLRTRFNNYPLLKSDGSDVTIHNNGHTIQAGAPM